MKDSKFSLVEYAKMKKELKKKEESKKVTKSVEKHDYSLLPRKVAFQKKLNKFVSGIWNNKERRLKYIIALTILFIYISGIASQMVGGVFGKKDEWGHVGHSIRLNPIVVIFGTLFTGRGLISMIMVGLVFVGVYFWYDGWDESDKFDEKGFEYSDDGMYGTAKLNREEDINNFMYVGSPEDTNTSIYGMINGKVVAMPRNYMNEVGFHNAYNGHTAVIGVSGSGKSYSYINTEVLQIIRRGESLILSDPKGDIYEETAQAFKDNGYIVKVFNLKPTEMHTSDSWNALEEVNSGGEELRESMAQTFADIIITNTSAGEAAFGDPFWDNAETNLLKALILYVGTSKSASDRNIGTMYEMLIENSEIELKEIFNSLPAKHPALQPWSIFLKAGENIAGNIMIGLASRLNVFQSRPVKDITSTTDIDLELPVKQKVAYYIIMSDQESTFSFLSSLFFSFLFIRIIAYADQQDDKDDIFPVNILLDEFPNVGKIPDFDKKISTVRSRKVRITFVIQNIAQLKSMYPQLWGAVLGNCDIQLFLGSNDPETEEFISKKSGESTAINITHSTSGSYMNPLHFDPTYRESKGYAKRNLFNPDEVNRMHRDTLLLFVRGYNTSHLDRFGWHLHPMADQLQGRELRIRNRRPLYRQSKEFIEVYGIRKDVEELVDAADLKTFEELKDIQANKFNNGSSGSSQTLLKELTEDIEETPRVRRRRRRKPTEGLNGVVEAEPVVKEENNEEDVLEYDVSEEQAMFSDDDLLHDDLDILPEELMEEVEEISEEEKKKELKRKDNKGLLADDEDKSQYNINQSEDQEENASDAMDLFM